MRAIVMEIKDSRMVVVDQNGSFHNLKYDGKSYIGTEIDIPESKIINLDLSWFKKLSVIAAVFLMILGTGYGFGTYYIPYSYVSVDINPSLELILNRYNRVIGVEKLNEDADKIISKPANLKNKKLEEAIDLLLENAIAQKFITDSYENAVVYAVSTGEESKFLEINSRLQKATLNKLTKLNKKYQLIVEKVSKKEYETAKKEKISPGKLILFKKLKEVKPEITIDEIKKLPIRESIKILREHKKFINNRNDKSKVISEIKNTNNSRNDAIANDKIKEDKIKIKGKDKIKPKVETKVTVEGSQEKLKEKIKDKKEGIKEKIDKKELKESKSKYLDKQMNLIDKKVMQNRRGNERELRNENKKDEMKSEIHSINIEELPNFQVKEQEIDREKNERKNERNKDKNFQTTPETDNSDSKIYKKSREGFR